MPYRVVLAESSRQLEEQLSGAIVIGPLPDPIRVGGLTLDFTNPNVTVTFSGSAGSALSLEDVRAEILAAGGGLETLNITIRNPVSGEVTRDLTPGGPVGRKRELVIQLDGGFGIDKDGTSNPVFGLSTTADMTSTGAIDPADIVGFAPGTTPGHYVVLIAP